MSDRSKDITADGVIQLCRHNPDWAVKRIGELESLLSSMEDSHNERILRLRTTISILEHKVTDLRPFTKLLHIGKLLLTQDNRITADPIFVVQQRHRIYGFDPDYSDDVVWLDEECNEMDCGDEEGEESEYTRTAYVDQWEFVTACFTEAAADAYIAANSHNLKEPRVYVESGHRNQEWKDIRRALMAMAGGEP